MDGVVHLLDRRCLEWLIPASQLASVALWEPQSMLTAIPELATAHGPNLGLLTD